MGINQSRTLVLNDLTPYLDMIHYKKEQMLTEICENEEKNSFCLKNCCSNNSNNNVKNINSIIDYFIKMFKINWRTFLNKKCDLMKNRFEWAKEMNKCIKKMNNYLEQAYIAEIKWIFNLKLGLTTA